MTIKASELRLGVIVADLKGNIKPCLNPYDSFEPIPLTEEWLVRFGFTADHNDYFFEREEYGVELEASYSARNMQTGETFGWHISEYKHVKSVHQLQNLYFALTGEEIKLQDK